jgi:hypothetical protein
MVTAAQDIQKQLSALRRDLPAPVQQALNYLQQQYEAILKNPNVQQVAQQLQQWQRQLQDVISRIPEPIRKAIISTIPGVNDVATAIQAKQAWDALPAWAQDTLISVVPFGDGVDLVKETYNAAIGKGVDPVVVTLSVVGLAGDLGWLDGIIPDPVDGVNAGAALLKAAYKQMGEPAKAALKTLIERVSKNADELAQFAKRLGDLVPNAQLLMRHPNALPRLFNLSDSAFKRAMSSPSALQEAIRRAEFADKFIGKKLSDLTPNQRKVLEQAYVIDKNGVVRRRNVDDGYTQLQIDNNGVIREGTGAVSDRLSNPTQMRNNYKAVYGNIPEGHQIHHLIPDSVVRDHELTQLAMKKAGYNLDESSNLLAMPYTGDALKNAKVQIAHLGSHPKWSNYVKSQLDEAVRKLEKKYGSLDNVPANVLRQEMKKLEKEFRDLLTSGDIQRLRRLGIIEENYPLDGQNTIRLSQNEQLTPANELNPPTLTASASFNPVTEPQLTTLPNAFNNDGRTRDSSTPDLSQLQQTYRQYAEIIHPTLATGATPLNQDQAIAYALSRSGYTPGQRAQIIAAGSDNIPGNRTQAHAYVQQTANWPEQRTQQPIQIAQRQQ